MSAANSGRSAATVSDAPAGGAPEGGSTEAGSTDNPDVFLGLAREECLALLREMIIERRFEEKAAEVYQVGKIGGFCHLYIGQEAVSAGAITPLRDDDYVITAYRDHAQAIARGMTPNAVMAELYGRVDGCSKGLGGSMHMFDKSLNFMGGHGIVGSHLPIAIGAGYAIRYRGGDQVCVCFFGDSVVNIGAFHESMNMAARWKLPVIFILENNRYGMGTDYRRVAAVKELKDRGRGYDGLTSLDVDGMDVLAVRQATEEAIERGRNEKTPSFIEARCFRYMGHSMADPMHGTYRTREEVEKWRSDDPILSFTRQLMDAGRLTEEAYKAMDREAKEIAEESAAFADRSPFPDAEALYRYVYSDGYPGDMRRRDAWRKELR
ncbi:pyruvate dehydrogenase (acetyl-transferring) E1 component subunit alpha [Candidatus Palauibacter sp.]|uniref:pyruvate dehydrogenase (acetyl-transferring) E1 component subunit alpha n=1 Tax=Candidatus Palauibacter sp. TaxID=3101350 RepID=UPI003B524B29